MAELNEEILNYLETNETLNSYEYAQSKGLDHQKVVGAIKSLQTTENVN
jgi:hypothetical protein